tara:strand:- start:289 stop:1503 length:1215 start_codon:yes stop_codon:yes gene_type:complete
MNKNSPRYDNEINLGKIFLDLWEGRQKIITSTIIAFIISVGFVFFKPPPSYQAITEIKPIYSIDAIRYNSYNSFTKSSFKEFVDNFNNSIESPKNIEVKDYFLDSFVFLQITPQTLLNLYIEQIETKKIFIDVIKDLEIYKKSDFENDQDYNNAILKLASRIKVLFPNDYKKHKNIRKHHQILFKHTDEKLWKDILNEFHKTSQEFVRNELIKRYNQNVAIAKFKKKSNVEDIEKEINIQKVIYNLKTQRRLAFLEEQAELARTLGIKKNTFETQNFDGKNFTITNIDTKPPFYSRGYESIEKEIALIKSRKDEKNYINEIVVLEQKKYLLNEDKFLERIERLFLNTPILDKENFVAVNLNIVETDFKYNDVKKNVIFLIAIILGLFVGSIYVLLSNSLINRKS